MLKKKNRCQMAGIMEETRGLNLIILFDELCNNSVAEFFVSITVNERHLISKV